MFDFTGKCGYNDNDSPFFDLLCGANVDKRREAAGDPVWGRRREIFRQQAGGSEC